jgi:phenylalanyl-tRNA synthetase beta chain
LRSILTGLGADEASSSSIVDPAEQRAAGFTGKLLSLANPMAAEESVLRATLLAGLVKALRLNSGHRNPEIRLFEIGDVFSLVDGEVEEHERIALLLARGDDDAHSAVNAWRLLADALGIERVEISQDACRSPSSEQASLDPALDGLHPSRRGLLVTEPAAERNEESPRAVVGALGEIDPSVLAAFEVSHGRVGWLELNLDALASAPRRPAAVRPASRYPSSDMDLAFLLDEAIPAGRLERVLREAGGEMLESLRLFDVYRGVGVPDGTRSLGYRLRVVAKDHTLTDAELSELQKRCIDAVEAALPARLRRN